MTPPTLIVFSGLPGTGKSTIARGVADVLEAIYLAVDAAEDAIAGSRLAVDDLMDAGYRVLWALATDNLSLGRSVVGDSVNPIFETRNGWRSVAHRTRAHLVEIETICSDPGIHQRRVDARHARGIGPAWAEVKERLFVPRTSPRIILDTALLKPEDMVANLVCDIAELLEK